MFRAAIADDRVHRIDFGLGDEPYKADWVDTPTPSGGPTSTAPQRCADSPGIARETASRLARRRPLD